MRFEVCYRSGTRHEVDLAAGVVVLGRDPSCDIVLNDNKCSRQHAMVEDGPDGLVIRDSASANGTFVNGRRVRQARLRPGDTVRMGDVTLTLLAEIGETVVVAPEDLELHAAGLPGPLPPPTRGEARQQAASAAVAVQRVERPLVHEAYAPPSMAGRGAGRPLTITLLVLLWAAFVPCAVAAFLFAAARLGAGVAGWTAAAVASVILAALGVTMALGLGSLAPWARQLQIATASVGLIACPFALAAVTVLLYMVRPDVRATFQRGHPAGAAGAGTAEPTFALSILAMLVLGVGLSGLLLVFLPRP